MGGDTGDHQNPRRSNIRFRIGPAGWCTRRCSVSGSAGEAFLARLGEFMRVIWISPRAGVYLNAPIVAVARV
jgi:hypothetical protein